jgi:hypothetical protein
VVRALISALVLAACGSDGDTPSCPPMPLYDITVTSERTSAEVVRAEREAIEAGCLTPRGEPAFSNTGGSATTGTDTGGTDTGATAGGNGEEPAASGSGGEP